MAAGCAHIWAQSGSVRSGNQAIPGATITATQGTTKIVAITDAKGEFLLPLLPPGDWTFEATMFGFAAAQKEVKDASAATRVDFTLQLQESQMARRIAGMAGRTGAAQSVNPIETQIQSETSAPAAPAAIAPTSGNDAFLVGGSLSPGMATNAAPDSGFGPGFSRGELSTGMGAASSQAGGAPGFPTGGGGPGGGAGGGGFGGGRGGGGGFRGPGGGPGGPGGGRQFGNRRAQSQIHGMFSFTLQNSALNAKPFSFTGQDVTQPSYAQSRFSIIVGGPLMLPKVVHDPGTFFYITYFGTRARNPQTFVETLPTAAERQGDFSQTLQANGSTTVPVQLFDPSTHSPLAGNIIPASRLNPIAQSLLSYIPLPNQPGTVNNYEFQTAAAQDTDNLNFRLQRSITKKDRLAYHLSYQRRDSGGVQAFGFLDQVSGQGFATDLSWTRTISPRVISTAQVTFNRNTSQTTPFFANGVDVAGELGIQGTSSSPLNYGPPGLNFTNFGALSDGAPVLTRNQSQSGSDSVVWSMGAHTFTFGGQYTRNDLNNLADQNGRGTFNFTGFATSDFSANGSPVPGTGFDFADFLLGYAQSSSIRYGDTATYFRQNIVSGYGQDDWKVKANLTVLLGLRYEYFSPFSEKYGHIANLDIGPDFSAVHVVTPGESGAFTGAFPAGLINSDKTNFAPRLGIAWKLPRGKLSTIVRAGYGIYYNGQAYIPFASRLAQQPPFAISNNSSSTPGNLLTLATGFLATTPGSVSNTYAVDKYYRTPYAQTWNLSVQQELPRGFFVEAGYLGTKGTHLDVLTTPNEGPAVSSAERLSLGNAAGYTYDSPVGNSIFHAAHLRATQRFRRGISMSAYYQYAKSIDDSSSFGGAGNTVAQNWLDLAAERGLSSFDRRHSFDMNWVLSSPVGEVGSRIAPDSWQGKLLKDWQLSGSITAQTGTPLTARVLGNTAQLSQTSGTGSGRAEATGESITSGGGFFNLNAFTIVPPGEFGDAGRNTIPGPGNVALNLTFGRSIQIGGESRRRLELRLESNNVLNHVNYTNLYTVVNATNYGLPETAASMRSVNAVVRFRF
jgi:hypothetical protein